MWKTFLLTEPVLGHPKSDVAFRVSMMVTETNTHNKNKIET